MKIKIFLVGRREYLVTEVSGSETEVLIDGCNKPFGGVEVDTLPIPEDTRLTVRIVSERWLEWRLESSNPRVFAVFNGEELEPGEVNMCAIGGPFVRFEMTIGYLLGPFMRLLVEKEAA